MTTHALRSAYGLDSGRDLEWLTRAACRTHDPEWWSLAPTSDPAGIANNGKAKTICNGCPVRAPCLEQARRLETHGMIVAGRALRQRDRGQHVEPRQCARQGCEVVFEPSYKTTMYCSDRCRSIHHSEQNRQRRQQLRGTGIDA